MIGRNGTAYRPIVRPTLPELFDRDSTQSAAYRERMTAIARVECTSATHLRGLAMTPVKFGISFTTKFLNQGNALVQVLTDGTVQVSTGATEMGQGVQTKIAQLVAEELGLDPSRVLVLVTSTERNANTAPTAASASTDLNGTAAVRAAAAIRERMAALAAALFARTVASPGAPPPRRRPRSRARRARSLRRGDVFDARDPSRRMSFAALADRPRRERVDLGARGFYATPGIDFDRETGRGLAVLLLHHRRGVGAGADRPLHRRAARRGARRRDGRRQRAQPRHRARAGHRRRGPGHRVGHHRRAGVGRIAASCSRIRPPPTRSPTSTTSLNALRFEFLENAPNPRNVRSTKALGEPPIMLGLSVWAAILHALSFVAPGEVPRLTLPATHEAILLAIDDLERRRALGSGSGAAEATAPRV